MSVQIIKINHLHYPQLSPFLIRNEGQLRHYYEPQEGLFIAESILVIERALEKGYRPQILLGLPHEVPQLSRLLSCYYPNDMIPLYVGEEPLLKEIAGFSLIRGSLALMFRQPLPSCEDFLANLTISKGPKRLVLLEDVVNPTNMGAIFRSAAAMGMDGVLLSPGCTDPLYRRSIRVSMGNVFSLPWTYWKDTAQAFSLLHSQGFCIAAMALKEDTLPIDTPRLLEENALGILLGSEGPGLQEDTLQLCDISIKIPMYHGVDSLNVAAASAVAFWELRKR